MRKYVLILLLFCAVLLWAQESSEGSGSIDQGRMPQPTALSSMPTSLLWQIGSDALQSSMDSLMSLGPWLDKIESSQHDLMGLSQQIWMLSQKLDLSMSEVSHNCDLLLQSMTSFVGTTTQTMAQLQKQVARQNIELWLWRATTLIAGGMAVYFAVR